MQTRTLLRIGGIGALGVALTQVVGNGLHPPIPGETAAAMEVIRQAAGRWIPVHLTITLSYFLFIPFAVGTAAAFRQRPAAVRVALPLVLVGAGLGAAQILTHYTIFNQLAAAAVSATSGMDAMLAQTFTVLWDYSVGMEVTHLLAIFGSVLLFGIAMLSEPAFRRWLAFLGIGAGTVAIAGILLGKFVIQGRTGDLVFGFGLLPLIVWTVGVGISLLRMRPAGAGGTP